jgi:hypothetical protein
MRLNFTGMQSSNFDEMQNTEKILSRSSSFSLINEMTQTLIYVLEDR